MNTQKTMNAKMKKANKKFQKMSPAEKRVAVAKDALKWLEAGKFKATNGTYFEPRGVRLSDKFYEKLNTSEGEETKAHEFKGIENCQVCAVGSLFVAKALSFNDVTLGDLSHTTRNSLNDFFEDEQLYEIERAFECCPGEPWFDTYKQPKKRLKAILENIIRNKGEFEYDELVAP